jgi:acetyl esterase/lipase
MRVTVVLLASLVVALPAHAQVATSPSTSALRAPYGSAPEQFGELHLPTGAGPFPVVVLIHGGCFLAETATLAYVREFADSLRATGIATWNIEYRRIDSPGGGWPGTFHDVARAADHVRSLAEQFPLDTTRVAAVGHSAGGFLALWLGAREGAGADSPLYVRDPLSLRTVVALGGDGDLLPIEPVLASICRKPVVDLLLGADTTTRFQRRAQANPADMPPSRVPQLLIAGLEDTAQTPELLSGYVARARAKDEAVEVIAPAGVGHMGIVNPKAAAWPTVRDAIRRVLGVER